MKKSAPAAKQDLAAWVSDEFEAKSPAHDDLARVSAAAAAMRGATPPRPPSTASAINKSRNSTPKSIGQSPRESMAALSKSSSKASMSGVQVDMMTAKSEVKPGVMVNVCKPAPPKTPETLHDGEDTDMQQRPQQKDNQTRRKPASPQTPTPHDAVDADIQKPLQWEGDQVVPAFWQECGEHIQALECEVVALLSSLEGVTVQCNNLVKTKCELQDRIGRLEVQLSNLSLKSEIEPDDAGRIDPQELERAESSLSLIEPIDITKSIRWDEHFMQLDKFFAKALDKDCLIIAMQKWQGLSFQLTKRSEQVTAICQRNAWRWAGAAVSEWRAVVAGCRQRDAFATMCAHRVCECGDFVLQMSFFSWRVQALVLRRQLDKSLLEKAKTRPPTEAEVKAHPEVVRLQKTLDEREWDLDAATSRLQEREAEIRCKIAEIDELNHTLQSLRDVQRSGVSEECNRDKDHAMQEPPMTAHHFSESRRIPDTLEIAAHVAAVRELFQLELSEYDRKAMTAHRDKDHDNIGRLERVRAKVHLLSKKFRFGLRAEAEMTWPSSAHPKTLDVTPPLGEDLMSPVYSFCEIVGEGSKSEDVHTHKAVDSRRTRKKAVYQSPTKGALGRLSSAKNITLQESDQHNSRTTSPSLNIKSSSAKRGDTARKDEGSKETIPSPSGIQLACVETEDREKDLPIHLEVNKIVHREFFSEVEEGFENLLHELGVFLRITAMEQDLQSKNVKKTEKPRRDSQEQNEGPHGKVDGPENINRDKDQALPNASSAVVEMQLKKGMHFLPDFFYLEDDQGRPPLPTFKSTYARKKTKKNRTNSRLEDLCRMEPGATIEIAQNETVAPHETLASLRELPTISPDEGLRDEISQLKDKLKIAQENIMSLNKIIQSLKKQRKAISKDMYTQQKNHMQPGFMFNNPPSKLNKSKSVNVKLPKLTREGSPTVEKGKFPCRSVLGTHSTLPHEQVLYGIEDLKRHQVLWNRYKLDIAMKSNSREGSKEGKMGQRGMFCHPQGGTPVRLVNMDTVQSTLALLANSSEGPIDGWRGEDALFSELGGFIVLPEGHDGRQEFANGCIGDNVLRAGGSQAVGASPLRNTFSRGSSRGRPGSVGDLSTILEDAIMEENSSGSFA